MMEPNILAHPKFFG